MMACLRQGLRIRSCFFLLILTWGWGSLSIAQVLTPESSTTEMARALLIAESDMNLTGEVQEIVHFPPSNQSATMSLKSHFTRALAPQQLYSTHDAEARLNKLQFNFELRKGELSQVAGRDVITLYAKAYHPNSPSWSFQIDLATGARLAYEQRASDGMLLAQGHYMWLDPPLLPSSTQTPTSSLTWLTEAEMTLLAQTPWPAGFEAVDIAHITVGERPALQFTAWDGLNVMVLIAYPTHRGRFGQRERPLNTQYLSSTRHRNIMLSALAPLPHAELQRWLTRLTQQPIAQLPPHAFPQWEDRLEGVKPPLHRPPRPSPPPNSHREDGKRPYDDGDDNGHNSDNGDDNDDNDDNDHDITTEHHHPNKEKPSPPQQHKPQNDLKRQGRHADRHP